MVKLFKKWNDLQQFHEVTKNLNYPRIHAALVANDYKIKYGLKIKLHGTNAGIRVEPDGKVTAQKRSSDISVHSDNAGFANWVASHETRFINLARSDETVYIYGEWAGPGIQSGVAVSELDAKYFFVFSIDIHDDLGNFKYRLYCPNAIEEVLGEGMHENVIVIPWYDTIEVNFLEKAKTEQALLKLNMMVEKIGECDPLIADLFELEGAGEGVVAYPLLGYEAGRLYGADEEYFSWFNFKAKSEAHRVNKTKTAVAFDPEKYASIQIFADHYCTEQRFLQGFREAVSESRDMRLTPDFIKWVVQDIYKESKTEREASPELDWKLVSKACSSRAVMWYKGKVSELC
jgi:hypothetical protein